MWGTRRHSLQIQIRLIVDKVTEPLFAEHTKELQQLIEAYHVDAAQAILLALVEQEQRRERSSVPTSRDPCRSKLVSWFLESIASDSYLGIILLRVVQHTRVSPKGFCERFCHEVVPELGLRIGLELASLDDQEWRREGRDFVRLLVSKVLEEAGRKNLLHLSEQQVRRICEVLESEKNTAALLSTFRERYADNAGLGEHTSLRSNPMDGNKPAGGEDLHGAATIMAATSTAAQIVSGLGPSCCATTQALKDVLQRFQMDVNTVAGLVAVMTESYDAHGAQTWNENVLVAVLSEKNPQLSWTNVFRNLDQPEFMVASPAAFKWLMTVFRLGAGEKAPYPLDSVVGLLWKNRAGQCLFLKHAINAPPELFSFSNSPHMQLPLEGLHGGKSAVGTPNEAWLSLDLINTLIHLADQGYYNAVHAIIEAGAKTCPELVLIGIAQSGHGEWTLLHQEVFAMLLPSYIGNHANSSLVLHRLWPLQQSRVIQAMAEMHAQDNSVVSRILDIAQDLKILPAVLKAPQRSFAIDVAALASRREYLNLEKWVQECIAEEGLPFMSACITLLREKNVASSWRQPREGMKEKPPFVPLSPESSAIFFKVLQANSASMPAELVDELKSLYESSRQGNPGFQSLKGPGAEVTQSQPAEVFAPDIEEEANTLFQKIYTGQQSIDDMIRMLKGFKGSAQQREQEIFACMVHNLFDEYRFFPKYPDKELRITAILFGSLINHQLVSSVTLGIALRYVLDAIRKPFNSKMFKFGTIALEQFKPRLSEWPQYCNHILQIQQLTQVHPELVDYVRRILESGGTGITSFPTPAAQDPSFVREEGLEADGKGNGPHDADKDGDVSGVGALLATMELRNQKTGFPGLDASDLKKQASEDPVHSHQPSLLPGRQATDPVHSSSQLGNGMPHSSQGSRRTTPQPSPQPSPSRSPLMSPAIGPDTSAGSAMTLDTAGFGTLNIDTLMQAAASSTKMKQPPEGVQDKVHFAINNLSQANMSEKSQEIKDTLDGEEFFPWLAQYLVVKRASIEPNFHHLYHQLLDYLALVRLNREILSATVENAKVLLSSEKIKSSSSERSLLKNLGLWLGALTLAKNKPLLQKDIDLKALLISAYEQGKMIAVVPFVSKVLDGCRHSKVYKPPNPWLMALVRLLKEIYEKPDLKLNLKFEMEMLTKNLGLDLNNGSIAASSTLGNKTHDTHDNPDFNTKNKKPITLSPPTSTMGAIAQQSMDVLSLGPGGPVATEKDDGAMQGAAGGPMSTTMFSAPAAAAAASFQNGASPEAAVQKYVVISQQLGMLSQQLHLKRLVPVALDRAVREIISPVVERSVTIACMTSRELISKDFAMESDENRMRKAAHLMVCSLAGSLALVTCKEPLRASLTNHLRTLIVDTMRAAHGGNFDQNLVERAVEILTVDNLELGCALIEKAATEKATRDIDELLAPSYKARKAHRETTGQPFYDMTVLNQQGRYPQSLPESLRPKPSQMGGQPSVYDDFARIPRHSPSSGAAGQPTSGQGRQLSGQGGFNPESQPDGQLSSAQVVEAVHACFSKINAIIQQDPQTPLEALPKEHELRTLPKELASTVRQAVSREEAALAIAQKTFMRLYELPASRLAVDIHVAILEAICDVEPRLYDSEITNWVLFNDKKLSRNATLALVNKRLVKLNELDTYLASSLADAKDPAATELAVAVVQRCIVKDKTMTKNDIPKIFDVLVKLSKQPGRFGEGLSQLLDAVNTASSNESELADGSGVEDIPKDPPGLREQAVAIFDDWMRTLEVPGDNSAWLHNVLQQNPVKDHLNSFIRVLLEMVVAHSVASAEVTSQVPGQAPILSFQAVDAYGRLMVLLVKNKDPPFFHRVLAIICSVLKHEAGEGPQTFNPRPYYRLLTGMLTDLLPSSEHNPDRFYGLLMGFSTLLKTLEPSRVPAFAFAWLDLLSHRLFMPRMLQLQSQKGWPIFQKLLVSLFAFMEPSLREVQLSEPIRMLYKGTLRVLLVLLHDFPEFLCENHLSLCDMIPPSCIQMRNLILSAFPRNMRLPDPFTPNLKVDLLPEINQPPRMSSEAELLLRSYHMKADIEQYLKTRQPQQFVSELKQRLLHPAGDASLYGTRYSVTQVNALVLFIGMQAIQQLHSKNPSTSITQSAPMDLFQRLVTELDTEGRYLFLNAIANQLRYPNNHTHYFSCVLLFLFAEATQEIVQEQITRVLLERLIVNRPHPWGLLITFIELIKNPRYNFWSHNFTRCAPEIERLFESVARSCMGPPPKPPEEELVSMGASGA
mmetsp:Transcript_518/g.1826  ORF Transcript_518/g.1826 Transcript_518/m.1826 type:complete len:2264 (-) Transcript_518:4073-10864(-)